MKLCTTRNRNEFYGLEAAVMKGLGPDGGLFVPFHISKLEPAFLSNLKHYSFSEISYRICQHLFNTLSEPVLRSMIDRSITIPAPLVPIDGHIDVLELFHGPSLAFKDFGARFMAQMMSYFNRTANKKLVILVATSGDTGGAVATGFRGLEGIEVVILFPKGKVSALQQKQLTTHGDNIAAIEIDGTFDDCQALVKQSFSDASITSNIRLSSANSINIARLIPQSFYYFEGYKQLETSDQITFSVPSGNFGNLTAGIIAKKLGLPIKHLVAATNVNDIVPVYLASERFQPRPSRQTLSNAMDVGNPSNFDRMLYFYGSTWNDLRNDIHGHSYSDMQTIQAIKEVYERFEYLLDPHGAVAYLAARDYIRSFSHPVIVLETAHPSKFLDTVQYATRKTFPLHPILQKLTDLQEQFLPMSPNYEELQTYLHERFN